MEHRRHSQQPEAVACSWVRLPHPPLEDLALEVELREPLLVQGRHLQASFFYLNCNNEKVKVHIHFYERLILCLNLEFNADLAGGFNFGAATQGGTTTATTGLALGIPAASTATTTTASTGFTLGP